ncbi:MAG: GIY-YIG nuclease family protein [Clostridia bacterium]|nr:GIY-YIG nuclease family protein [Clostridia bacterium]
MYWVYIIECSDGTFYTGWTNDLVKRMAAHGSGRGAKYTRGRTPVTLKYTEECASRNAAMQRERQIQHLPRSEKKALIESHMRKKA